MAGVDVDQLTRIPVEHDEGGGGKPVAGRVPEQMPVDLRRQRRQVRCHRREAPHQRLNVGGQQRGRHALAGHVGHHEERAIARQVDDIEVVAAHGTQRLVERVDFVTRDLVDRGWLQGLLNLLSRELLGLELRLADQLRCERGVLDAEADVVDQQNRRVEDHTRRPHDRPDERPGERGPDGVALNAHADHRDHAQRQRQFARPVVGGEADGALQPAACQPELRLSIGRRHGGSLARRWR